MAKILLIETASPKRILLKAKQILHQCASPAPEISILCRESSRSEFSEQPGLKIYSMADRVDSRLRKELNNKNFDVLYAFWTGEKKYRRTKLLAIRLKAADRRLIAGDGNEFRLTWKAVCRHSIFRLKHPLPTDHWDFVPPQPPVPTTKETQRETKPVHSAQREPEFQGERILILQTAEPSFILNALDLLKEKPLFKNPRYTVFCRNRPEIVNALRNHPLLYQIRMHSETRGSFKHLRELRRSKFNAIILFLTGDPSYRKLKTFALLLGVSLHRTLIFNESNDCFFFNWRQWLGLVVHRLQSRPIPSASSKWAHSARILVSLVLKSALLPFRFSWLLLVWLRLRSAGLRAPRKNHDESLRLPLFPGT